MKSLAPVHQYWLVKKMQVEKGFMKKIV